MRRLLNTLVGRLALLQLCVYGVLLPVLFFGLDAVNRSSGISSFTQHARGYASSLARELELGDILESPSRTVVFLDGSVEARECLYAAIELNGRLLGSSVTETPGWVQQRGDDLQFGKSSDGIYAVAVPLRRDQAMGMLYLGFDEQSTLAQLRLVRQRIIEALAAYGVASILVTVFVARLISHPLHQLQLASRRVAKGNSTAQLGTDSTMVEIIELSRDLDNMRSELVGTAEQLRSEMHQRRVEQAERAKLESHLRHEQRLATVGTLAGGVAHEFNNILVPMILYTEEALDEISPDHAARPHLERVMKASNRASQVVTKLLAFSRPMAERAFEAVDLARVASEALDLSQALMPANIELIRNLAAPGAAILGDATLLNQVILNLCSNAVQAMRDKGGILTVSVGSLLDRTVELRVQDTGIGMSAAIQERIFEPFFTTREVGEGAGLGLSIVHGIVASMGGVISVNSEPGAGSDFRVVFPQAPAVPG